MMDYFMEFAAFVLEVSLVYLIIQIVINWLAIRALRQEIDQFVDDRMIPVTVEFDSNQYYCYNKNNREFIAQGTSYDEIKTKLESRFRDHVVYIADGDPAVITKFLEQQ